MNNDSRADAVIAGQGDVTRLLHDWSMGDGAALDEMLPLVYQELRKAASHYLRYESGGHTLQTTALVNEVYLQLRKTKQVSFESREQFFCFAGQVIRHILVQYARNRLALKRGGDKAKVPIDCAIELADGRQMDFASLIALNESLNRLEAVDPRQSQVIELRFFAGMNNQEISRALKVSANTVMREWRMARAWLIRDMQDGHSQRLAVG